MLATASLDFYAEAIGQSLGFDHMVATRAAWRDEKLTGQLDGENLNGEAKLAAVTRLLTGLDREVTRIVAYSDDQTDLPILRFADHGIAIDPTPKLAVAAKRMDLTSKSGMTRTQWAGSMPDRRWAPKRSGCREGRSEPSDECFTAGTASLRFPCARLFMPI